LVVPYVAAFPGHIACSSLSQSEIVVPLKKGNEVVGVLDVDSIELNHFDSIDQQYLEQIISLLEFCL
ncbi:MAG: GAF domain-containing protein, partial [Sediminibacterium sp.]|nr:GAF domain-containing protein [Sediminibacterium sp.]